jgi:hypothetical protein
MELCHGDEQSLSRALCRYHRSRRARTSRRQRAQLSHQLHLVENSSVTRSGAPQPDAHAESFDESLRRMSLAAGKMPVGHPVIPLSGTAPPAGLELVSPAAGTMPPWTFPYGLNTTAQWYASSISTNMGAYEELSGHHRRSTLDLVASTPASEYQDSTNTPGTEHRAIASRRYDPID